MSRIDNKAWREILKNYAQSKALERRALHHLHDRQTLNELTLHLADYLSSENQHAVVRTESVWIDGTPQAKATTRTASVQCELADLLILMTVTKNSRVTKRSAVLIQAKVGTAVDIIPGGDSTKKERSLLEEMDHSKKLSLYRDTQAKSLIGEYQLRSSGFGLRDYARYMVMPVSLGPVVFERFAPFVTGWPSSTKSSRLKNLELFKSLPVDLWLGSVGHPMNSASPDEWTDMIEDLLGYYAKKRMKRFNGFDRHLQSSEIASFMIDTRKMPGQARWARRIEASGDPPDHFDFEGRSPDGDQPPALPVISFVIELLEGRD